MKITKSLLNMKHQYRLLLCFILQLLTFSTFSTITLANPVSLKRITLFPEEYTQKEYYFDAYYIDVKNSNGRYLLYLMEGNTVIFPNYFCNESVMAFVLSKNLVEKLVSLNLKEGTMYRVRIYTSNNKKITDLPNCELMNSSGKYGYYSNVKKIQFLSKGNRVVHDIEDETINNDRNNYYNSPPAIRIPIEY